METSLEIDSHTRGRLLSTAIGIMNFKAKESDCAKPMVNGLENNRNVLQVSSFYHIIWKVIIPLVRVIKTHAIQGKFIA